MLDIHSLLSYNYIMKIKLLLLTLILCAGCSTVEPQIKYHNYYQVVFLNGHSYGVLGSELIHRKNCKCKLNKGIR